MELLTAVISVLIGMAGLKIAENLFKISCKCQDCNLNYYRNVSLYEAECQKQFRHGDHFRTTTDIPLREFRKLTPLSQVQKTIHNYGLVIPDESQIEEQEEFYHVRQASYEQVFTDTNLRKLAKVEHLISRLHDAETVLTNQGQ